MRGERDFNLQHGGGSPGEIAHPVQPVARSQPRRKPLEGASVGPSGLIPSIAPEGDPPPFMGRPAQPIESVFTMGSGAEPRRERQQKDITIISDPEIGTATAVPQAQEISSSVGADVSARKVDTKRVDDDQDDSRMTIREFLDSLPDERTEYDRALLVQGALEHAADSETLDQSNMFEIIRELDDTDEVRVQTKIEVDPQTQQPVQKNRIYAKTTGELREIMRETYRFAGGDIDEEGINDHITHAEQRAEAMGKIGATDIVHMVQFGVDPQSGDLSMQPLTMADVTASKLSVAAAIAHPEISTDIDINDLEAMGYTGIEDVNERVKAYNNTHEDKLPRTLSLYEEEQETSQEHPEEKTEVFVRKRETLTEEEQERRSQNWLRTLSIDGMTIGMALDLLRLEANMYEEEFSASMGVDRKQFRHYKWGDWSPLPANLKTILSNTDIDPSGYVGRLYQLLAQKMTPLTIDEFVEDSSGKQLEYFRIQEGMAQIHIAKELGYAQSNAIGRKERGERPIYEKDIMALANAHGIDPDNIAIRIMLQRVKGEEIVLTEQDRHELLQGPLLFKEVCDAANSYELDDREASIEEKVNEIASVGKLMRFLRKEYAGITIEEIAERTGITENSISFIERDIKTPKDIILIRLMAGLGFTSVEGMNDPHHPFTKRMMLLAQEERASKRRPSGKLIVHEETIPEEVDIITWAKGLLDEGVPADFFAFSARDPLLARRLLGEVRRFEDIRSVVARYEAAQIQVIEETPQEEKEITVGLNSAEPEKEYRYNSADEVIAAMVLIKPGPQVEGERINVEDISGAALREIFERVAREEEIPVFAVGDKDLGKRESFGGHSLYFLTSNMKEIRERAGIIPTVQDVITAIKSEKVRSIPWSSVPDTVFTQLTWKVSESLGKPRALLDVSDFLNTHFPFLDGNSLSGMVSYFRGLAREQDVDALTLIRDTTGIEMPTNDIISQLQAEVDIYDWYPLAPCSTAPDPNVLYPDKAEDAERTIHEYCDKCPVRGLCLAHGIENRDDEFGDSRMIWGGMTKNRRTKYTQKTADEIPNGAEGVVVFLRDFNLKELRRKGELN